MANRPMPITFTGVAANTAAERGAAYSRRNHVFLFHPRTVDGPPSVVGTPGRDYRVQLSGPDLARLLGQIPADDLGHAGEDVVQAYLTLRLFLNPEG